MSSQALGTQSMEKEVAQLEQQARDQVAQSLIDQQTAMLEQREYMSQPQSQMVTTVPFSAPQVQQQSSKQDQQTIAGVPTFEQRAGTPTFNPTVMEVTNLAGVPAMDKQDFPSAPVAGHNQYEFGAPQQDITAAQAMDKAEQAAQSSPAQSSLDAQITEAPPGAPQVETPFDISVAQALDRAEQQAQATGKEKDPTAPPFETFGVPVAQPGQIQTAQAQQSMQDFLANPFALGVPSTQQTTARDPFAPSQSQPNVVQTTSFPAPLPATPTVPVTSQPLPPPIAPPTKEIPTAPQVARGGLLDPRDSRGPTIELPGRSFVGPPLPGSQQKEEQVARGPQTPDVPATPVSTGAQREPSYAPTTPEEEIEGPFEKDMAGDISGAEGGTFTRAMVQAAQDAKDEEKILPAPFSTDFDEFGPGNPLLTPEQRALEVKALRANAELRKRQREQIAKTLADRMA